MDTIDPDLFVSSIRASAEEVFVTMLGSALRFQEAHLDKGPATPLDGVICLIGMAGKWSGTGTMSCSAEFACQIASQMLMAEYTTVSAEVLDAVAEIANMVLGNVKTALEERLGPMGMSIPAAVYGKNFLAKSCGDESWTEVLFDCGGQRLEVKLCLKPAPEAAPRHKYCTPVYLHH